MNAEPAARKNVLVVDDDPAVLKVLARLLEDRYDVRTAESGRAALLLAAVRRPDAVLLDVSFPSMDGIEILRELRKLDGKMKVLMMTGDSRPETVDRALADGALAYLTKPFSIDEVEFIVDHTILFNAARA